MALFGDLTKGLMDNLGGGGEHNKLMGAVAQLLSSPSMGGLSGLVQMFHQKGESGTVQSWVSNGENQPISPDKVQEVLGQERVKEVADTAGVSEEQASHGLAQILPQLVNQLTPEGKLPENDSATGTLSQLAQRFLKH
ncbi:MAG: YidB family protein [Sulfurifustaceae bacterium]